jgi:hypothetical protein
MTSQNIKDEFIYVSVQDNVKLKSRQRKTKIDIDEFKSGTTNITLFLTADFGCVMKKSCAPKIEQECMSIFCWQGGP